MRSVFGRAFIPFLTVSIIAGAAVVLGAAPAAANPDPLAVTMTAAPNPVSPGGSLTYTVTATNAEPNLSNVRLTDQLSGLKNVVLTSSRGYCTESNLLVTCDAGSLPGQNSTWTVTITGTVTAGTGTYLNNTATVVADSSAQNTAQTYSVPTTARVLVGAAPSGSLPDLTTAISAPATAAPGAAITYAVSVTNAGGTNASDVAATATVASGFAIGTVTASSLFNCTVAAPTVTCRGGALSAGATATINVNATVNATTPAAAQTLTYKSSATVDPENAIVESDETNNASSHTLTVPATPAPTEPMTFTKTVSSPVGPGGTLARPGDTLTYTITTKDTGTSNTYRATGLVVTDGTQGLDAASVTAKSSDATVPCVVSASQVKCTAANKYTMNPGGQLVITVTGKVVAPPSTTITNTATLQALQNKVAITRTASVSTSVRPGIDLTVTTAATCPLGGSLLPCPPIRARSQFDLLVSVGNSGLDDAAGVTVRIVLPTDAIFEGYDNLSPSGGFTCAVNSSNVVTCTGGSVPGAISGGNSAGSIRQLRLHLTAPDSTGTFTITTTVDPYNTIAESDESNNTYTTTVTVETGIDLAVSQAVRCPRDTRSAPLMCDPVAPSGTLIYDVVVQNLGSQDASGVKVTDTLPEGTRFRSAKEVPNVFGTPYTPAHNLSCSASGTQVDCVGGTVAGTYAASGGAPLSSHTAVTPDTFTIEITAYAPAPFGPSASPNATAAPILNQVRVDPDKTIPEVSEANNLNVLETKVGIPPAGDWGTFDELTVTNRQTNPASGAVAPNGTLDYTLTVANWGSDPVTNVIVYDYIPDGARFRNATGAALANGTGGFSCSFDSSSARVTCTNGALAASPGVGQNTTTTITIRLYAPGTVNAATTQYTNHAVVDPANAIAEADETNNVDDAALTVALPGSGQNAYNELSITNAQTDPASGPVAPNGSLTYRLTVKNSGSDPADNIAVRDAIPQGARFRNVTADPLSDGNGGFNCSYSTGTVSCANGSLAGGGSAQITILLFAPPTPDDATTHYTNHAVVDPDNTVAEADETNNVADRALGVALPPTGQNAYNELAVNNVQSEPASGAVAPNGTLAYTLTVTNTGSDAASNVVVRDTVPQGARFRNVTADALSGGNGGFTCAFNVGVVTCSNGSLAGGGSAQVTILLFAPPTPDDATTNYTNHAVVDPDNTVPEADETNNVDNESLSVALPPTGQNAYNELTVTNVQTDPASGPVAPNGTLQFTLTVKNSGSDTVRNVVVYDYIAQGSRFRNVTADPLSGGNGGFVCSFNAGLVSCTSGTVAGGGSTQIKILLFAPDAPDDATTHYTNHAVVDPDDTVAEADESNNVADRAVTVDLPPTGQNAYNDLTLSDVQAVPSSTVAPSGTLIYRLTIQNAGSDPANNVVVRDYLPAGTTFRSAKFNATLSSGSSGFTCSANNGVVQCSNGSVRPVASGGTAVIDLVLFAPVQPGTINNQAAVDPDNTIPEADETNNTAISADTSVAVGGAGSYIELQVGSLTATPDPVGTNTPVTYTIDVDNDGTDQAFNVKVTNRLPAGSTFVAADDAAPNSSGAFSCAEDSGLVTCTGGSITGGGTREITIVARSPLQSDVTLVDNQVTMTDSVRIDPDNTIAEGDETNNTASATVTVLARVDLSVTNDGSDCAGKSGDPNGCNWTFTVTNNGPDAVSDVVVRTDFPVGVIPLDVQAPNGWSCQITQNPINQVTCTTGSGKLPAGSTDTFALHSYVTANTGDRISSTTIVDPDDSIVETNESDDTASDAQTG